MTSMTKSEKVKKGQNWLKACMHCLSCNDPVCSFSACRDVKQLLWHIFSSSCFACAEASASRTQHTYAASSPCACGPVRALLSHWIKCQDSRCEMCSDLWADIGMQSEPGGHNPSSCSQTGSSQDQSMDSSMTESSPSRTCSPAVPTSAVNSQNVTPAPSSSDQSCSTTDVQPCPEVSGSQGVLSRSSSWESGSPATGTVAYSLDQHNHTQVIYFLELLLQCFVQKAPSGKFTQEQANWLPLGKQLWQHLLADCPSMDPSCAYPGCQNARAVLRHRVACQAPHCSICTPVKQFFQRRPAPRATVPDMQVNGVPGSQ
ncbi:hypothetical protein DUNSADRAFT_3744 [Dunaliella salina]|uniref:TAZ-type domain-containing protein n=1 Tax=Dunaliella salina TaxID=3046 RepID=A0ABQ7FV77_DUNSA|nr:hypothetical protein DUNSADRAFT_3744 [Dunaliella salina]|eukprot:KAF5826290.1 hypothetical protein DUNSADRAFT_3744 [Dunaliella salina]